MSLEKTNENETLERLGERTDKVPRRRRPSDDDDEGLVLWFSEGGLCC